MKGGKITDFKVSDGSVSAGTRNDLDKIICGHKNYTIASLKYLSATCSLNVLSALQRQRDSCWYGEPAYQGNLLPVVLNLTRQQPWQMPLKNGLYIFVVCCMNLILSYIT